MGVATKVRKATKGPIQPSRDVKLRYLQGSMYTTRAMRRKAS